MFIVFYRISRDAILSKGVHPSTRDYHRARLSTIGFAILLSTGLFSIGLNAHNDIKKLNSKQFFQTSCEIKYSIF